MWSRRYDGLTVKVNVDCNQFDYGLSKKMFSKITEQIYGVKVV